jgi:hypothetical protein
MGGHEITTFTPRLSAQFFGVGLSKAGSLLLGWHGAHDAREFSMGGARGPLLGTLFGEATDSNRCYPDFSKLDT